MEYRKAEAMFKKIKDFVRRVFGFPTQEKEIHSEAVRKQFAELPPEHKLELIKPQLDFFTSAVSRKTDILPAIATLSATLIIVATLNPNLVPLSSADTKVVLSIFLILIPVTLNYYIKVMEKTARKANDTIASYQGKDPFRNIKISFLDQLSSDFPIIIVYLFYGIIFFILFKMWQG